jgi:hypothetical protein
LMSWMFLMNTCVMFWLRVAGVGCLGVCYMV